MVTEKIKSGAKLYQEMLRELEQYKQYSDNDVTAAARAFAEKDTPENRTSYMVAKARHAAWVQAEYTFKNKGHEFSLMGFPDE